MAVVSTRCPHCEVEVEVPASAFLLDDEDVSYTFTCPREECGLFARKRMDGKIRTLLRGVGVPTFEEVVASARVVLEDDKAIWKEILA